MRVYSRCVFRITDRRRARPLCPLALLVLNLLLLFFIEKKYWFNREGYLNENANVYSQRELFPSGVQKSDSPSGSAGASRSSFANQRRKRTGSQAHELSKLPGNETSAVRPTAVIPRTSPRIYHLFEKSSSVPRPCVGLQLIQVERTSGRETRYANTATVVTVYYLVPSKHLQAQYNIWMAEFLLRLRSPVHIFTNCQTLLQRKKFAGLLAERDRLHKGRTHTQILQPELTQISRELGPILLEQQWEDPERFMGNNFFLGLVWFLKAEVLKIASEKNVFGSEWFLYCDIGVFRANHPFRNWPSPSRLARLSKDRVLFEAIQPISDGPRPDELDPALRKGRAKFRLIYEDHLAGGYIGLRANTAEKFLSLVLDTARLLYKTGHLVVKDQVVYNTIFLRHPEFFTVVPAQSFGDPWFYMSYWLADRDERGDSSIVQPIVPQA